MNFLAGILNVLPGVIDGVERIFGSKRGPEKESAVLAMVAPALKVPELVANKDLYDEVQLAEGFRLIIRGFVLVKNATGAFQRSE